MQDENIPALPNGFRFQWEPAQESHVLLYPEGMKVLSETAAEIVQLCDGKQTVGDIVKTLSAKFPGVDLRNDVIEFLQGAKTEGWIIVES